MDNMAEIVIKKLFRKIILSLLALSFSFTLASCSSKLQLARDLSQEIINAFIEKDEEALYLLFSSELRDSITVKEQIQTAFDFIDGKIISYELPNTTGGGGKERKEGKVVSENICPIIENIKTDLEKEYQILFQYFSVFCNERGIGIDRIIISQTDENGKNTEGARIDWYQPQ